MSESTDQREDDEREDDESPAAEPPPAVESPTESPPAAESAAEPAGDADAQDAAPKKKKKKAKAKAKAEAAADAKPKAPVPLPGAGTAEGDQLREANVAFESGNYARVRELTQGLDGAKDPAVADAARNLAQRISVDPVQLAFMGACAIALMVITWIYILEPHSH